MQALPPKAGEDDEGDHGVTNEGMPSQPTKHQK